MNGKLVRGKLAAASIAVMATIGLCASADAADMSRPYYSKAEPAFMPPLSNWSGFYVGANFGATFSDETVTNGASFSTDPSGVLGGLQVGYNYQFAPNMLVGVEYEMDWTTSSGTGNFGAAGIVGTVTSNHNWYDTLDARLGWQMANWLLYVKGGVAWMNADYNLAFGGPGLVGGGTNNVTRVGWNIGVGAEFMIMPQWSAKAEYNYLDFGNDTVNFPVGFVGGARVNTDVHEFKVGLNYHLMPGTIPFLRGW